MLFTVGLCLGLFGVAVCVARSLITCAKIAFVFLFVLSELVADACWVGVCL